MKATQIPPPPEKLLPSIDRRNFFRSSLATAVALSVPAFSLSALAQNVQPINNQKFPILSKAVTIATQDTLVNLWSGAKNQSLGPAQKASAITALSITFAYMQEVGYNTALQRYILSNKAAILNGNTDTARISQLRSELSSLGITVSLNQAERVFAPGFEQRKTFFAQLNKDGIAEIEQSIVVQLSTVRVNQGTVTPAVFRSQGFPEFSVRQIDCAADGIVAGILGLASPPGVDALFAIAAVSYDLLSYAGAC